MSKDRNYVLDKSVTVPEMMSEVCIYFDGVSRILFGKGETWMSIETAIEKKIREAIENGEFDNLPGRGKPLDLDAYFNTPEDLRMAFALLQSNEFVPAEVELLKEMERLKKDMGECDDAESRAAITKKINDRMLALKIALESRNRKNNR